MKGIKCFYKSLRGNCHINDYPYYLKVIREENLLNKELTSVLNDAKKYLFNEDRSFIEILSFKTKEVPKNYEKKIGSKSIERKECTLLPGYCENEIYSLLNEGKQLKNENALIRTQLFKIDEVIWDLKNLYEETGNSSNDIFFNFHLDKSGFLICTYFNIDNFVGDNWVKTLYLTSEKASRRSRMYITYSIDGILTIGDFISEQEGQGYGTFMLEQLLELVPKLNAKLDKVNMESFNECKKRMSSLTWAEFKKSYLYKNPIYCIKGEICPNGERTVYELKEWYMKRGFVQGDNLYRKV
jgi:hypothetical protein